MDSENNFLSLFKIFREYIHIMDLKYVFITNDDYIMSLNVASCEKYTNCKIKGLTPEIKHLYIEYIDSDFDYLNLIHNYDLAVSNYNNNLQLLKFKIIKCYKL